VLTFRRDFLKSRPADVAALMRIWHRAEQFVQQNPEQAIEIVARLFEEQQSQIRLLTKSVHVLDLADNGRAFSYAAGFESLHASWRRMNDFMLERGLVAKRVDGANHLDSSFLRTLDQ
jgi:NitT/TauT family transport system substrate-binding protein